MLKNENGSLLVDALLGLLLALFMTILLTGAYRIWSRSLKMESQVDIYELYQEGTGLYDD